MVIMQIYVCAFSFGTSVLSFSHSSVPGAEGEIPYKWTDHSPNDNLFSVFRDAPVSAGS